MLAEPSDNYIADTYGVASLGTLLAAGGLVAEEATEVVAKGQPIREWTLIDLTPWLVTLAVLGVMQSAAERDRLGGNTFKVLALGLAAGAATMLYAEGSDLVDAASTGKVTPMLGAEVIIATFAGVPAVRASWAALQKHGLPFIKIDLASEGALLTVAAVGYAVTALQQVSWGGQLLLYEDGTVLVGALRCFVVSSAAYVCQTAAIAGSKRLSSDTYKQLNAALAVDAAVRLFFAAGGSDVLQGPGAASADPFPLLFAVVAFFAAAFGWIVGATYQSRLSTVD